MPGVLLIWIIRLPPDVKDALLELGWILLLPVLVLSAIVFGVVLYFNWIFYRAYNSMKRERNCLPV